MITIMITGHRPERLGNNADRIAWIKRAIGEVLDRMKVADPTLRGMCGMARGSDLWFGEACLDRGIPLVGVAPFEGQDDRWDGEDRKLYARIKAGCVEFHTLYPGKPRDYGHAVILLHARNSWLVDHCQQALAVWDGTSGGGTYNTIKKLRLAERPTGVLDPGTITGRSL